MNIDFEIFNFSNNIQDYFSKVNLAITRSGSSMLAELINVNIPLFYTITFICGNHQLKNAIYYEKNGFGYLIEERDISKKLFQLIKQISENNNLLDQIKAKQRQHSDKTVYENIDKQLYELINEKH